MLKRFTVSKSEDRPTNPPLKLISSSLTEVGNQRIYSRSISWNASGSYLAMGSSDRMTRLWTVQDAASSTAAREIVTIAGHGGNVDRVRFHPVQDSLLATASGGDGTVRLWDIRGATSKAVGKLDLSQTSPTTSSQSASTTPITKEKGGANTIQGGVVDIAWSTKPSTNHLVAATSNDGYGEITLWNWEETDTLTVDEDSDPNKMNTPLKFVYPAHTGPIYSMGFSSDGKRLATGAGDAVVGLWDVSSMACTATMIRCSRFIRSVSFSHDSRLIAVSTEDDVVDIGMSDTGMFVGNVPLSGGRSRTGGGPAGADEIAFHPKSLLLACARCDSVVHPPLTIVKLKTEAI